MFKIVIKYFSLHILTFICVYRFSHQSHKPSQQKNSFNNFSHESSVFDGSFSGGTRSMMRKRIGSVQQ